MNGAKWRNMIKKSSAFVAKLSRNSLFSITAHKIHEWNEKKRKNEKCLRSGRPKKTGCRKWYVHDAKNIIFCFVVEKPCLPKHEVRSNHRRCCCFCCCCTYQFDSNSVAFRKILNIDIWFFFFLRSARPFFFVFVAIQMRTNVMIDSWCSFFVFRVNKSRKRCSIVAVKPMIDG